MPRVAAAWEDIIFFRLPCGTILCTSQTLCILSTAPENPLQLADSLRVEDLVAATLEAGSAGVAFQAGALAAAAVAAGRRAARVELGRRYRGLSFSDSHHYVARVDECVGSVENKGQPQAGHIWRLTSPIGRKALRPPL